MKDYYFDYIEKQIDIKTKELTDLIQQDFDIESFYSDDDLFSILLIKYYDFNISLNTLYLYRRTHNIHKEKNIKRVLCKCSNNDCLGIVVFCDNGNFMCNICSKKYCELCGEMINNNENHVCQEENRINFSFIKNTTTACPCCGTRINKESGCSQMFCTNCHTGFDYNTGKEIKGNFHNPHRMEWLQSLNKSTDVTLDDVLGQIGINRNCDVTIPIHRLFINNPNIIAFYSFTNYLYDLMNSNYLRCFDRYGNILEKTDDEYMFKLEKYLNNGKDISKIKLYYCKRKQAYSFILDDVNNFI